MLDETGVWVVFEEGQALRNDALHAFGDGERQRAFRAVGAHVAVVRGNTCGIYMQITTRCQPNTNIVVEKDAYRLQTGTRRATGPASASAQSRRLHDTLPFAFVV